MKTAIANGKEIPAGSGAPAAATCPACGAKVVLRRHGPAWAYHHAAAAPACPRAWRQGPVTPRDRPAPEYFLFVAAIREAIKDALDGGGPQALEWLFSQEAQTTLSLLLDWDEEQTLAATEQVVDRLKQVIAAGQADRCRLRKLVALNAFVQVESFLEHWEGK